MANYPVEAEKRLSESSLWDIQQNYFNERGVDAWNNEIPFFISSNAFISNRYAQMCIQYAQDRKASGKKLYIVEVGAGPGKFTFYFLKAFERYLKDLNLNLDYKYILTDVAAKNVEFCRQNETFKPLIEAGKLDFALFNAAHDEDFHLLNEQVPFSELVKDGSVIFICNYVFDIIKHDLFHFDKDVLSEVQLALTSRYDNFNKENPSNLRELDLSYKKKRIEAQHYYDDPDLNDLLFKYPQFLNKDTGMFLVPIGATQFYDRMAHLCDDFLIICGDLGFATLDELATLHAKNCHLFEGCICFVLNFHALGEYIKSKGGDALLTQHRNAYKICLYTHGQSLDDIPRTKAYFLDVMETMGADEFCYLNDEFALNNYRFSMKACLSFLRMSCYEPDTYFHMHDKLIDEFDDLNDTILKELRDALIEVEDNLYHYQSFYDVFSLLGMLHLKLGQYKHAEKLFKLALKYGKSPFVALRSLGMLFDEKGNSNLALNYYKKALAYNKKDVLCKTRVSMLEGSPALVIKPILKAIAVFGLTMALLYLAFLK